MPIKFVWCLGHHRNGRFEETGFPGEWRCHGCGTIMEKMSSRPDLENEWRLVEEVPDDPDQGSV